VPVVLDLDGRIDAHRHRHFLRGARRAADQKARVLPRLAEPVAPFGRSPFANAQGQISGYLWYKAAQRASRFTVAELARALARAASVDVLLKTSSPPLETLTVWVAELVAGE